MAKPRIPNSRRENLEHKKRIERYAVMIQQVYDKVAKEASFITSLSNPSTEKPFSFADYPMAKEAIKRIQSQLMSEVRAIIMSGTSEEWKESNLVQDLVAKKVLTAYTGTTKFGEEYSKYFQTNPDALQAFQQRKDEGMNLSTRVWTLSEQYKEELEEAITAAIAPGIPAMELAAEVKKYLKEPDKRFRRIKEKMEDGTIKWHLSNPAKAYHPGRGVYRSSARNAQRLARTEINMAYRTAEQTRWQQFDFVVGYEVKTTQNGHHVTDICDQLAGKYPKDFVFKGWHPQCMCYTIPILKTEEEFWNLDDTKSVNEITEVPENFREWINDNRERIETSEERGKLPYFIRDNKDEVDVILHPELRKKTPLEIAIERHEARTHEDVERIRTDWSNRKVNQLWDAINNGLLPSNCASKIEEMKEDILFGDFDIFNKKAKVLDTAIKRHSKRSHSNAQDIQDSWDAKKKRDMQTKAVAANVLKVAQNWSEVDYSTLEQMIADNNLTSMKEESKKLANAINAMKAEENALSDIIPDVHKWHAQFSIDELKKVKESVIDKLDTWDWASDISIDKDPKALKKKLDFEISWIESKKKYSTWEVAKAAYGKQLSIVEDKLYWDETKLKAESIILKLHSVSPKLAKKFDKNLNDLIVSENKKSADIMLYNLGKWDKILDLESTLSSGSIDTKDLQQFIKEGKLNKAWNEYQSLSKSTAINPFEPSAYTDTRKSSAYIAKSAYEADTVMLPDAIQAYSKASLEMKEAAESYTRASGSITKLARAISGYYERDTWYADKSLKETLALTDLISLNRIKMDTWLYRDERSAFLTLKSGGLDVDKLDEFSRLLSQKLRTKNGGLWDTLTEHEYDSKMKQYARTLEKQLIGRSGIDPSFLSCGSHSNHHFSGTGGDNKNGLPKVRLEIYCPKGTQALYAAPFNHYNGKITGADGFWDGKSAPTSICEAEVFLQRDSKFRIIDARYDFNEDRWFVKVEVIAQDLRTIDGNEYVSGEGYKLKFK